MSEALMLSEIFSALSNDVAFNLNELAVKLRRRDSQVRFGLLQLIQQGTVERIYDLDGKPLVARYRRVADVCIEDGRVEPPKSARKDSKQISEIIVGSQRPLKLPSKAHAASEARPTLVDVQEYDAATEKAAKILATHATEVCLKETSDPVALAGHLHGQALAFERAAVKLKQAAIRALVQAKKSNVVKLTPEDRPPA